MSVFFITFLAVLAAGVLLIGLLFVLYGLQIAKLAYKLRLFTESPGKDDKGNPQPSALAELVSLMGRQMAFEFMQHAKGSLMADQSTQVRQEKQIEAAVTEDLISQASPIMSLLYQMPQTRKLAQKNPHLIGQIATFIMSRIPAGAMGAGNGGGRRGVSDYSKDLGSYSL